MYVLTVSMKHWCMRREVLYIYIIYVFKVTMSILSTFPFSVAPEEGQPEQEPDI